MKNRLKQITGLSGLGLSLLACGPASNKEKAETKPNIIFIMADDHAYQAVSAYGHGLNQTPNIDRIASEGALFENSFVTNSISGPSRATMLTGKYSHRNGFYANGVSVFDNRQQTLPKILRQNGYSTAIVGKWHLGSEPTGFDYWSVLNSKGGQGDYYNPDFNEMGTDKRMPGYVTDITTDLALNWLDKTRDKKKPFMLMLHHKAPHRNWMPKLEELGKIKEGSIKLPENFFDTYEGRGRAAKEQALEVGEDMLWGHDMKFTEMADGKPLRSKYHQKTLERFTPEEREKWEAYYDKVFDDFKKNPRKGKALAEWKYQRYMHDYLNTVTTVDKNVGRVLDYLDSRGLAENTIIVYTSDQGFFLGEHGWFDKRFMYEESFRMPLMMRFPKKIKKGTRVKEFVMNLDFMPTFLDYAGIDVPEDVQGMSFRQVAEGDAPKKWRKSVYYHYYHFPGTHSVKRHYGVRTDRYKLIRFYHDNSEWELYDLKKDPHEMQNVFDNPDYAEVARHMKEVLKENQEMYGETEESGLKAFEDERKGRNRRHS